MSTLTTFRDHCRAMADGGHSPDCLVMTEKARSNWGYFRMFREWPEVWGEQPTGPPTLCGGGCVNSADRELFARLADEVDAYLTDEDEPLWGEQA